jgi:hypothetical protein
MGHKTVSDAGTAASCCAVASLCTPLVLWLVVGCFAQLLFLTPVLLPPPGWQHNNKGDEGVLLLSLLLLVYCHNQLLTLASPQQDLGSLP